jgi:hypothetical protein
LCIENLLIGSKTHSLNGESTTTRPKTTFAHPEEDDIHRQSPVDDRHERTGSVKFADQADEGKEV